MTKRLLLAAAATLAVLPAAAHAHRAWLLPSSTVLSGEDALVTVDAAMSNTLFYFDHAPMRVTNVKVHAPDGSVLEPANVSTGEYRSTFDVDLPQNGTYNVESFSNTVTATYTDESGAEQTFRGTPAEWEASPLSQQADIVSTWNATRTEFFVTVNAPTDVQPSNEGLELVPSVHPNDLYAGETARFRVLLNGEPVADQAVEIVLGGSRYRTSEDALHLTSDANGEVEVTWAEPGMYWVHAENGRTGRGAPPGSRGAAYNGTFEVLPQ